MCVFFFNLSKLTQILRAMVKDSSDFLTYSLAFTKTKTFKSCLEKVGYSKVTGTETQTFYVIKIPMSCWLPTDFQKGIIIYQ